jgi:hypothetical protein
VFLHVRPRFADFTAGEVLEQAPWTASDSIIQNILDDSTKKGEPDGLIGGIRVKYQALASIRRFAP